MATVYRTLVSSVEPLPDVEYVSSHACQGMSFLTLLLSSSFVLQTGDTGSGKHPLFALSRKAHEKNVSGVATIHRSM